MATRLLGVSAQSNLSPEAVSSGSTGLVLARRAIVSTDNSSVDGFVRSASVSGNASAQYLPPPKPASSKQDASSPAGGAPSVRVISFRSLRTSTQNVAAQYWFYANLLTASPAHYLNAYA
jgi:hypothetical protein